VTLQEVEPPVWRRLVVPSDTPLPRLGALLQAALGWEAGHVGVFDTGVVRYGPEDAELEDLEDDASVRLAELLPAAGHKALYEYDPLGDSWQHLLAVEQVGPSPEVGGGTPRVLAGERACPPEDIGGAPGYEDLLEALADPAHEGHAEAREVAGEDFDPEAFDLAAANAGLRKVR
jgi:hypothetical protein